MASTPIVHYIPVGTTETQIFQALLDEVATDLTGITPTVDVVDKNGRTVTLTGTVAWSDATVAKWSYVPDGQLTVEGSPYRVRLRLTDGSSIAKAPNGKDPDLWWVVSP